MPDRNDDDVVMLELKADLKDLNEDGTFSGIASVYGIEDLQGDIIDKGAFRKTLSENPSRVLLWQHDPSAPIGKGTLKEWQNKILIEGKLSIKTIPKAMEAYNHIKEQLVEGLSIGFQTVKSTWEEIEGRMVRHITELKLYEVSLVTFGALEQARITRVKAAEDGRAMVRIQKLEEKVQALETIKVTPDLESAKVEEPPLPAVSSEPVVDHSGLSQKLNELKETFRWNLNSK